MLSSGDPTPLVRWEGIGLTYAGTVPVRALHPTDLVIDQGTFVAITGPSGAGKSTLLNLLGLLDRPTTGQSWMGGRAVSSLDERQRSGLRARQIGFVFQAFHLLEDRSTLENVEVGLLYCGLSRRHRREMAKEAIGRVGMGHRIDAFARTLSGGERQRVAIARAIARRPALLLADEPTGSLDSENGASVLGLFRDLRNPETTIVVVTHSAEVADAAERIIEVRDGDLVTRSDSRP